MVCASCPPRIEMAIGRVKGVARVEANYLLGKVVVQYNAAMVGARMIKAAIEALDYTAELWDASSDGASASDGSSAGHAREARRYRQEFFWSICFAGPLLVLMMGLENIPEVHEAMMTDVLGGAAPGMLPVMALVAWIAATPVQLASRRFMAGGLRQLANWTSSWQWARPRRTRTPCTWCWSECSIQCWPGGEARNSSRRLPCSSRSFCWVSG